MSAERIYRYKIIKGLKSLSTSKALIYKGLQAFLSAKKGQKRLKKGIFEVKSRSGSRVKFAFSKKSHFMRVCRIFES